MKIINIADKLTGKKSKWAVDAMKKLKDSGDPNGIIRLILYIVAMECEIGLGLLEEGEDLELQFFHQVNDVYQKAAGDCYFCKDIDPNEIKFDKDTQLCITCKQKMSNFLRAIGIEPNKILFGVK
ncbi:hypothetical protein KAR91_52845 [Candidatus Pacearchaeota archaeon]|nr:hypothetical protein [Candidatus Pacearchaeota archaeon]